MDAPDGSETTVLALMAAGLSLGAAVLAVRVLWWRWRELVAPPSPSSPPSPVGHSRFDASVASEVCAARSAARAASAPSAPTHPAPAATLRVAGSQRPPKVERTPDWLETSPAAHPGPTDWTTWVPTTTPNGAPGWSHQALGVSRADSGLANRADSVVEGHGEGDAPACSTARTKTQGTARTESRGNPAERQWQ